MARRRTTQEQMTDRIPDDLVYRTSSAMNECGTDIGSCPSRILPRSCSSLSASVRSQTGTSVHTNIRILISEHDEHDASGVSTKQSSDKDSASSTLGDDCVSDR
jgi:hypothetical protein